MQLDGYDVASAGDRVMRTDPTFSANKPAVMMAGQ
jgi:hypothetical protein